VKTLKISFGLNSFWLIMTALMLSSSILKEKTTVMETSFEGGSDKYPIPPKSEQLLFYVQRTPNTNTIVYNLNFDKGGKLNKEEPVLAYWIRYQEQGQIAELNYIQRKYAYGVVSTLTDEKKESYSVEFVSYSKRKLSLLKSANGEYHAYTTIKGKTAILNSVFLNIEGGSFWMPRITSVEIKGTDPDTKAEVVEIFKP
jgi:hypothetical protein